jgi:predicted O-methyltransferase YrrM
MLGAIRHRLRKRLRRVRKRARRLPPVQRVSRRVSPVVGEWRIRLRRGDVADIVFGVKAVRPKQIRSEVEGLRALVHERSAETILEIGTARGGTTALLADAASPDATVISVDLAHPPEVARRLHRLIRQELVLVTGYSDAPETVKQVHAALRGRPLDVLFIDGDHSYEAAKRDYELYAPLVPPGGLIGFHDIVPGRAARGVPDLWQELRDESSTELVEDWSRESYGIGVLRV